MESSGAPGAVHITEKTREQLEPGKFNCEEVETMTDQVIVDSGLKTFLIKSKSRAMPRKTEAIIEKLTDDHGRQFSDDSGIGSNESTAGGGVAVTRSSRVVIQVHRIILECQRFYLVPGGA